MATIVEEKEELQRLLRLVCKSGVTLPKAVADWWVTEQQVMAQEQTLKNAQKAARLNELLEKKAAIEDAIARLA